MEIALTSVERTAPIRPSRVGPSTALDVYAVSLPATLFTGDFYHFASDGGGTWFAIGDVTGHGLDSAIFMAMIQEFLEERLVNGAASPSQAVASIYRALAPELPVQRFVSLVLGHLSSDGLLRLTNAGHCPPLIVRRDAAPLAVAAHGPILNALVPPGWSDSRFELDHGEKVVLYTDGVYETSSPDGEELGIDRIGLEVADRGENPRAVAHALIDAAARFRAPLPLHDDLTVMVLQRR